MFPAIAVYLGLQAVTICVLEVQRVDGTILMNPNTGM